MGRNSQQRRAQKQRQEASRQRTTGPRAGAGGLDYRLDEVLNAACLAAFGPGADKPLFGRAMAMLHKLENEADPLDRPTARVGQVLRQLTESVLNGG